MPDLDISLKSRLWQFRYKIGQNPVESAIVEAKNVDYAERIARKWCETQGTGLRPCRYVSVRPFIIADESILVPSQPEIKPAPGDKLPNLTRAS